VVEQEQEASDRQPVVELLGSNHDKLSIGERRWVQHNSKIFGFKVWLVHLPGCTNHVIIWTAQFLDRRHRFVVADYLHLDRGGDYVKHNRADTFIDAVVKAMEVLDGHAKRQRTQP
jgi:hypothetical protein